MEVENNRVLKQTILPSRFGAALLGLLLVTLSSQSLAATTPAKPPVKPPAKVVPKVVQKVAPKPVPKPTVKVAPKPPVKTPVKAPVKPPTPPAKPAPVKPVTPPKPPVKAVPDPNANLLQIPTGQPPPAGTAVLLKHFGAVAQGKGLEMTETLYDFETMTRRVVGDEWVKMTPAGQRYAMQLIMVFFKANMSLPGLGNMIRHVRFKSVTGGNLEGFTLIRYEQTFEGPYKGLVQDERAGLLLSGQGNNFKIVDTEKEGRLLSQFLRDSLSEIRLQKPDTTMIGFLQDMVLNHGANLVGMENSLKQIQDSLKTTAPKPPGTTP